MTIRFFSCKAIAFAVATITLCATSTFAVTTTYTGPSGAWNKDSWNTAANWDSGAGAVPTGMIDVEIGAGKHASANSSATGVTTPTPAYTGNLTLLANAKLEIGQYSTADDLNALGTGTITMNAGSNIVLRHPVNTVHSNDFVIAGDATFSLGRSTSAHWEERTISGGISGSGLLTIHSTNGNILHLTNTNIWSGGLLAGGDESENKKATIEAEATGSLGTGDVTIDDGVTLQIEALNAMDIGATLNLNGNGASNKSAKLVMDANSIIESLYVDGLQMPPGEYSGTSGDWIDGTGLLIVEAVNFPRLTLRVNRVTGDIRILGHSLEDIDLSYYEITSAGNSLDDTNWNSLADQDFEAGGPPSGAGDGWEESGGVGTHALAEAFLLGGSTISIDVSVSLGRGYDSSEDAQDLAFTYSTIDGTVLDGDVEYVSCNPDIDNSGTVDGNDLQLLLSDYDQNEIGCDGLAPYGPTELDLLLNNFGRTDLGASAAEVPEPTSMVLLLFTAVGLLAVRLRK